MMAQNMLAVPERRAGDFWIFWTGQTISQIGSALTSMALPLLVFKLSGSALDLGLASLGGLVIDQVKKVVLVFGVLGVFLVLLALVFVRSPLTRVEGYLPHSAPESPSMH